MTSGEGEINKMIHGSKHVEKDKKIPVLRKLVTQTKHLGSRQAIQSTVCTTIHRYETKSIFLQRGKFSTVVNRKKLINQNMQLYITSQKS